MKEDILINWEKKSAENQKKYTNFLKRADKNCMKKLLKKLIAWSAPIVAGIFLRVLKLLTLKGYRSI
jgi:hypothetical protein